MTFQQAVRNLNRRVRLDDKVHRFRGEFILSGVTVRKNGNGVFAQAELADPCGNSVMIAALVFLHEIEKSKENSNDTA